MRHHTNRFTEYQTYLKIYAEMLHDLSDSESYIYDLIANRELSDISRAIRQNIESTLREE